MEHMHHPYGFLSSTGLSTQLPLAANNSSLIVPSTSVPQPHPISFPRFKGITGNRE